MLNKNTENNTTDYKEINDPIKNSLTINLDDNDFFHRGSFEQIIKSFRETGNLGKLKSFVKSLLSIKPTSTDTERSFSIAGIVISSRRRKIKQDLLNAILIIKSFYKN